MNSCLFDSDRMVKERIQNVVKQENQDIILEMLMHYQTPSSEDILWREMSDENFRKKKIRDTYANL